MDIHTYKDILYSHTKGILHDKNQGMFILGGWKTNIRREQPTKHANVPQYMW